jgi:hypothetical protein
MLYPVFKGSHERYAKVDLTPMVIRDGSIMWRKDFEPLDRLPGDSPRYRSHEDAYMGACWRAEMGPIMLALEPRPRVAVLLSVVSRGGLGLCWKSTRSTSCRG